MNNKNRVLCFFISATCRVLSFEKRGEAEFNREALGRRQPLILGYRRRASLLINSFRFRFVIRIVVYDFQSDCELVSLRLFQISRC